MFKKLLCVVVLVSASNGMASHKGYPGSVIDGESSGKGLTITNADGTIAYKSNGKIDLTSVVVGAVATFPANMVGGITHNACKHVAKKNTGTITGWIAENAKTTLPLVTCFGTHYVIFKALNAIGVDTYAISFALGAVGIDEARGSYARYKYESDLKLAQQAEAARARLAIEISSKNK